MNTRLRRTRARQMTRVPARIVVAPTSWNGTSCVDEEGSGCVGGSEFGKGPRCSRRDSVRQKYVLCWACADRYCIAGLFNPVKVMSYHDCKKGGCARGRSRASRVFVAGSGFG